MTTRNWGGTGANGAVNGQSYAFNAGTDVLSFPTNYAAWKLVLADAGSDLSVTYGAKTITLLGMSIAKINHGVPAIANITFFDGSVVQVGVAAADTFGGSGLGDLIYGLGGNDTLGGGAGADLVYGGNGNDSIDGGGGIDTLVGGAGNDVYTVNLLADVIYEDSLHGGAGTDTVLTQVDNYVLGGDLENLTLQAVAGVLAGTGNGSGNRITGNLYKNELAGLDGDDSLVGQGGADTLDGGPGNDTMNGGPGNDLYYVDSLGDSILPDASGVDTVRITDASGFDYTLPDTIEKLDAKAVTTAGRTYTGNDGDNTMSGGAKAESMIGGNGDDSLMGAGGNDSLDGGAGDDTLNGGAGNDTYVVDSAGDSIIDSGGSEIVRITGAGFSFALGAGLEQLDASAATSGGSYTGNSAGSSITGSSYDDTLAGGSSDTLDGGAGNDTYALQIDITPTITDSAGTDTVKIDGYGFDYTLGAAFENLDASSAAASGAHTYTGNASDNLITASLPNGDTLIGSGGNDSLVGGSTNFDQLNGGAGDDHYYLKANATITGEDSGSGGGGTDTVHITDHFITNYTLGADLENLDASQSTYQGSFVSLTGNSGNNTIIGTDLAVNYIDGGDGNDSIVGGDYSSGDHLTGGNGDDTLDGKGSFDTFDGGYGNDTYYIDSDFEPGMITDAGGTDSIHIQGSPLHSFSLISYPTLENVYANESTQAMTLTGSGSDNIIVGSSYNDSITGGGGNDYLEGGSGTDTLVGSTGNDVFRDDFSGAFVITGGAGSDTLQAQNGASLDFTTGNISGIDVIDLGSDGSANVVTVSAASLSKTDSGHTLYINGSGNDAVSISDPGNFPWFYSFGGYDYFALDELNNNFVAVAWDIDVLNSPS